MAPPLRPVNSSLLLKRVVSSLLFSVCLASVSSFSPLHWKTAEGVTQNLPPWGVDEFFPHEEWKDQTGGKSTSGTVAGKVFGFMSKVMGEVGNDVKNSVLYGMSKLRTSEKYKKAKYLINAPSVDTQLVNARLQRWGEETLRFAHAYACMYPDTRAALLKLSFGEFPSLVRVSRKYVHIGEVPDADGCYKSLVAMRAVLEETIERVKQHKMMQHRKIASPAAEFYESSSAQLTPIGSSFKGEDRQLPAVESPALDNATDLQIRRAAQLIQLVIKLQPRVLFYLVHPFSNGKTLANELAFYLSKMVPVAKQVFALTWRLNSALPRSSALANKRMMADYLVDALDFEEGLRALLVTRKGYPCEYNPQDDYYFVPPPPATVLQILPLSDTV